MTQYDREAPRCCDRCDVTVVTEIRAGDINLQQSSRTVPLRDAAPRGLSVPARWSSLMFLVNDYMATTNDVELSYSIAGAGPPLVVTSPGWGIGSDYLKHGLKPLLEYFTIVFVTTRGSGRSTRPADISRAAPIWRMTSRNSGGISDFRPSTCSVTRMAER